MTRRQTLFVAHVQNYTLTDPLQKSAAITGIPAVEIAGTTFPAQFYFDDEYNQRFQARLPDRAGLNAVDLFKSGQCLEDAYEQISLALQGNYAVVRPDHISHDQPYATREAVFETSNSLVLMQSRCDAADPRYNWLRVLVFPRAFVNRSGRHD